MPTIVTYADMRSPSFLVQVNPSRHVSHRDRSASKILPDLHHQLCELLSRDLSVCPDAKENVPVF